MVLTYEIDPKDSKTLILYLEEEVWKKVFKWLFLSELKKIPRDLSRAELLTKFASLEEKLAKKQAIYLLSKRSYLSCDLEAKLLSCGLSKAPAVAAVQFCREKGYLDDAQMISRLVAKEQRKGRSAKMIYYKLKQKKGISEELLREQVKGGEPEREILQKWLAKHAKKYDLKDRQDRMKLMAKLMRAGFSSELVQVAINSLYTS